MLICEEKKKYHTDRNVLEMAKHFDRSKNEINPFRLIISNSLPRNWDFKYNTFKMYISKQGKNNTGSTQGVQ